MLDVLIADDDDSVRESVASALASAGHRVTQASDGEEAAALLSAHVFDLAVCDVHMPKLRGTGLLRHIRREAPWTTVVLMTSFVNVPDAIESIRDGAADYVKKPFDPDEFTERVVGPIAERHALRKRFEAARATRAQGQPPRLVTESPLMRSLGDRVAVLAHSDVSVLVAGERGAGKGLVAAHLHTQGLRRDGPLVFVEGSLLVDEIEESDRAELAERGRLQGAWFRRAMGGTLVVDGLERVPRAAQLRLLAAIESPEARAARSSGWAALGVRLVTLTRDSHDDLAKRVATGEVDPALYYRLSGVTLRVPPLRERAADLCPLVTQLLREIEPPARTVRDVTPAAFHALAQYAFPGNVRELRWALEHAVALGGAGPLDLAHLPAEIAAS